MRIGFIGTGVMGTGIINNLLRAGEQVTVFNRTPAHAKAVLANGASWAASPAALVAKVDVVFTMVGFPQDVEAVYLGPAGLLAHARPGQILVDMTTSRPSLAQQIGEQAREKEIAVLDAPVSGGDIGAKAGTLTVMVGGDAQTLTAVTPLLRHFSKEINHFGGFGAGQHAKMANQIMVAGTMTGLTEALVYARATGLDLKQVMTTLQGGAAANFSLQSYGPRILKGDYTPGFFAKHFLKDLRIALDEAQRQQLNLPSTQAAKQLYEVLVDQRGLGEEGTQALVKLWWS